MFVLEGALILGALVLVVLSGPPAGAYETPAHMQGLENTPEPQDRAAGDTEAEAGGALIVLDASGIDDGGYFEELADIINAEIAQKGRYVRCLPGELPEVYAKLASQGQKPNVVMGPDGLVAAIGGLADISGVYGQLYFNEAADRCVTKTTLPLALSMYAYYFRMDIMHDMRVYVPRSYGQLSEASALIAAKNSQLRAFAFEPGTEGCQLMLQQMVRPKGSDIYECINMLSEMRARELLLEDFEGGGAIARSLKEGSAVMAFAPGDLYAQLLPDRELRELVQVKPWLGNDESYTASVISCAITAGPGYEAAQRYLVRLFREGIDPIIVDRNPQLVNPGMEYSLDSPWAGVLTNGESLILLNGNMMYSDALMDAFGYRRDSQGQAQ